MQPDELSDRAKAKARAETAKRLEKVADRAEFEETAIQPTRYQGYDVATGTALYSRLGNGTITGGKVLTNAAIGVGQFVEPTPTRGGLFRLDRNVRSEPKKRKKRRQKQKQIALPCGRPIFVKLQDIFYEFEPVSWPVSAVNGDVVTVDSGSSSPIVSEITAETRYGFEVYYSTDSGGEIAGLSLGSNYYIRSENDGESNSFLNYEDSKQENLVTLGSYTAPVDVNLRSLGGGLDDRVLGQTYEEWIAGLVPSPIGNNYSVYPIDPSPVQIELVFSYLTEDTSPKAGAILQTLFNDSSREFRATMLGIFDFVVDAPGDYGWKIEQELGVITEVISGTVTVTEDNERLSNGLYIARPEPADSLTSFSVSSVIPNGLDPSLYRNGLCWNAAKRLLFPICCSSESSLPLPCCCGNCAV